jgi:hypothetical protein
MDCDKSDKCYWSPYYDYCYKLEESYLDCDYKFFIFWGLRYFLINFSKLKINEKISNFLKYLVIIMNALLQL